MAQLVERVLGKDEVPGPNPGSSSRKNLVFDEVFSTKSVLTDGRNPHFVRVKSLRGEIRTLCGSGTDLISPKAKAFDFTNGVSR